MANARYYSSVAPPTTLTGGVGPSNTTIQVVSTAGLPGSTPYTLSLDYGSIGEELVDVTAVGGLTLTVTRGVDGTSATSHNVGAVVRHVTSARDFTESRTHEASSSGVHGVVGSVVGTSDAQTLANKTLDKATGTLRNVDIYNTGVWRTAVIGDSTNPTPHRMVWMDNEVSLNPVAFIAANGRVATVNQVGEGDGTYRFQGLDSDGTTVRFYSLSGGTMGVTPTTTTNNPAVDIVAPDLSATKRAIRVAAAGGGSERFTVWNDGKVDIVGGTAAAVTFDVTAPAAVSADIMRVMDSGSNTQFAIQSTGKMLANKGGIVAQPGVTTGAVLQVGGSNVGYTGNLTQWVGPANTIVASINQAGALTLSGTINLFTQFVEDTTTASTSSTTYGNSNRTLQAAITVPPSGKVKVTISTKQRNSANFNSITSWLGSGSTSGTVFSPSDTSALIAPGNILGNSNLDGTRTYVQSGLVSGETFTVTMQHRVSAASTSSFDYRSITLDAAGA